jgi:hypothetical protein
VVKRFPFSCISDDFRQSAQWLHRGSRDRARP